jgi:Protein kinase domain
MTVVPNARDPIVGQIIAGRYQIEAWLGEGAVGVVYKARHVVIGRLVALKLVRAELAADPTYVQGLFAAAAASSQIGDQHIGAVLDHGLTADNKPFLVAELLEGRSLRDELARGRALAPERVLAITRQVCAALASAHGAGVLHRDLKPENVFLVRHGGGGDFVRVLDFGPAEPLFSIEDDDGARAGRLLGRPEYMAPEQARGRSSDARSDLYSLGVVAYEMLAGRPPFYGPTMMDVAVMHLGSPVPPLPDAVPDQLRAIVSRALEKDPARRFQSAAEMLRACERALAGPEAAAVPPEPPAPEPLGDLPRAPIETIPIDTHGLAGAAESAAGSRWTARFPGSPEVDGSGSLEVGRTYEFETAIAAGDEPALPDGASVRFGVHAHGIGVRLARGPFSSTAESGDMCFAAAAGTTAARFELRGETAGPARVVLSIYVGGALVQRRALALSLARAGARPVRAEPLPAPAALGLHLLPSPPARARVEITDDGELQIETRRRGERPCPPYQPFDQLVDTAIRLRARLVALSEAYRPDRSRPPFGIERDEDTLFEFARIGAEMHRAFFGPPDGEASNRELARLAAALSELRGTPQPRLQIVAEHLPFPWAVMYDGACSGRRLVQPGDVDLDCFWGARFRIDRALAGGLDGDLPAALPRPLAVRACLDPTLDASNGIAAIARQRQQFTDAPGAALLSSIESRADFMRYLADDSAAPCDLLYFFCRARAAEAVSPALFRPAEPPHVHASIALDGDGDIDIKTMRELCLHPLPGRPLVFMNACSSEPGDQAFHGAFLAHFVNTWRARGFIGADWKPPIVFADVFARHLLRQFLDDRRPTIADAFARAAADAFAQRNPFPLIYALHVRPDLTVGSAD